MKKVIQFGFYSIVLCLSLFLLSCDSEDISSNAGDFKLSQNDGYFPLTIKNKWVYSVHLADLNTDGSISYDEDSITMEYEVSKTNRMTKNNEKMVVYEFSPIISGGLLGKILGNFNRIYKNENGEYFKSEVKEVDVVQGNSKKRKIVFDLKDIGFVGDNANVGDVLNEKLYSYHYNLGKSVYIDYKIVSVVTGKYTKIPDIFAATPGIDFELRKFNDILHITDYIEIVSIRSDVDNVNVFLDAKLKGLPDVDGGLHILGETYQYGTLCVDLFGISLGGNGCAFKGLVNTWFPETQLGIARQVDNSLSCPTEADLVIDELFDVPLELISNQRIFTRDIFYARNVGPIKTIISTHDILGQIQLKQTNNFQVEINQRSTDPLCKFDVDYGNVEEDGTILSDGYGRIELILNLEAVIDNVFIDVPLSFEMQKSIVQNLKSYFINN